MRRLTTMLQYTQIRYSLCRLYRFFLVTSSIINISVDSTLVAPQLIREEKALKPALWASRLFGPSPRQNLVSLSLHHYQGDIRKWVALAPHQYITYRVFRCLQVLPIHSHSVDNTILDINAKPNSDPFGRHPSMGHSRTGS